MSDNKSARIRICFVSPKAYGLFNPQVKTGFGGAEVDLYLLAAALAGDGDFDVSFITADYGQQDAEQREGVRIIKSLSIGGSSLSGARKIWSALKRAGSDLYFIESASAGVPLVYLFCRLHGKKFIYRSAHTDECDGTYIKRRPFMGRLFAFCLRRAGQVFVQNQSDSGQLRRTLGVESMVMPNAHRQTTAAPCRRDCILWVGRSAGFKCPQRFFELARRFYGEHFVMICRPATGDMDYQSLEKQAGRIPNLEFIADVDFHRIDDYFARAKVFVNTSDSEGFANTFIQACKNGTAILSYVVNPDNFLTRFSCGLCGGGKFELVARGLESLLAGQQYLKAGENAKWYFRQRHDIEKVSRKYKAVFSGLAGR